MIHGTIEVNNIHQKDTYHNKIELYVDDIVIVIGLTVKTIWRDYVMSV